MKFSSLFKNHHKWYHLYPQYVVVCIMLVEIEEDDHRAIELKIKEEDISVMYIIQHEILKDKNIEFAGVVLKHALIRDYVMRIISKSGSSMSILHKSFESAMNSLEIIQGMLSAEFKKEEVSASS